MSWLNFPADCATPATVAAHAASTFREWVCPVTANAAGAPSFSVTRRSSSSTLAPSPSASARNEAWVPVVPLTPRRRKPARRKAISSRSRRRSWIQRQARFPTVVGCAGWKWVQARVGRSACRSANSASAATTQRHLRSTTRIAPCMTRRSPLSTTKALVAPRWSTGPPAGATSPKARTWAMTSWRSSRSSSAARAKSILSAFRSRSATCSAVTPPIPSSRWASARAIQIRRHVRIRVRAENRPAISSLAYRSRSGLA